MMKTLTQHQGAPGRQTLRNLGPQFLIRNMIHNCQSFLFASDPMPHLHYTNTRLCVSLFVSS
jgi:hypothetical protein